MLLTKTRRAWTSLEGMHAGSRRAVSSRAQSARKILIALLSVLLWQAAMAQKRLDTTTFIVVGEGLAAGMADFALREVYQRQSFPAQVARQMNALFPQPLIESPGIGEAPGFATLPPRLPGVLQGSVRTPFPPYLFVFNLSVPGFRLADAFDRRPVSPLIHQRDPQQTAINFILGYPALIAGADLPVWSQAEYAVRMNPTFVMVALGYQDVLEPAVADDPTQLPDAAAFREDFARLLSQLQEPRPELLVLTVPDPFDTAHFTTLDDATRLVGAAPATLVERYDFREDDLLTPRGLMLLGNFTLGDVVIDDPDFPGFGQFFSGTVVSAATRAAVSRRVEELNVQIRNVANSFDAPVYDLHALFKRIRNEGLWIGQKQLTAEFLGGFYSLSGYYPGATGHALIANELLDLINQTYQTNFQKLDLTAVASEDPAVRFMPELKKANQPPKPRRLPPRIVQ
jgi:hypothetical protein